MIPHVFFLMGLEDWNGYNYKMKILKVYASIQFDTLMTLCKNNII
jgi:hypothetical protein